MADYNGAPDAYTKAQADVRFAPFSHTQSWSTISNTPTTIGGYGITDAFTQALADARYSLLGHTHTFASLTSKPTTLVGYGITDSFTQSQADALYSILGHTHTFASLTSKPTDVAGYGITDVYTKTAADARYAATVHNQAWSTITSTPTTIGGYGITDFNSLGDARYGQLAAANTWASNQQAGSLGAGVSARGFFGMSNTGVGFQGQSVSGTGAYGYATSGTGLQGETASGLPIFGFYNGTGTNAAPNLLRLRNGTSATPTAGFGGTILMEGSSTTTNRSMASLATTWVDATDATRKSRTLLSAFDTAARECIRFEASGSASMIGFLGAAAVARQTLPAAATDPATTMALANSIRSALIANGLAA